MTATQLMVMIGVAAALCVGLGKFLMECFEAAGQGRRDRPVNPWDEPPY
jgi:hypothetical protein